MNLRGNAGVGRVGIGNAAAARSPSYKLQLDADNAAKPGTNTWTIASDFRLKDTLGAYDKGLRELVLLHPVRYRYKPVAEEGRLLFDATVYEKEFVGFLAQEVAAVFPEAVDTTDRGYLGFNFHPVLVAYLNAIKDLYADNIRLREELARLSHRLDQLEKEIQLSGQSSPAEVRAITPQEESPKNP